MSTPSFSTNEVLLVRYPFSDLRGAKVRPAVIASAPHRSTDLMVVPLTSHTSLLRSGEFALQDWAAAGLHVPTAVKRGLYTVAPALVVKRVGHLGARDAQELQRALRLWLGL